MLPMTLPFFFSLPPRTRCNPLRQPSSDWKQAQHIWKLEKLEFLCQLLLSKLADILAAATRCEPQTRAGSQCWQHLLLISWEELHAAAGNRSPWPLIYGSFGMKPREQLLARWSQERGSKFSEQKTLALSLLAVPLSRQRTIMQRILPCLFLNFYSFSLCQSPLYVHHDCSLS